MVAKEYTERAGVYKVQTFGTTQFCIFYVSPFSWQSNMMHNALVRNWESSKLLYPPA
jgi:hypothetical protein